MSYTCYTIKVELDDDLRRLNFDRQPRADNGLSFAELESQIRELFNIPAFAKLRFTYVDCDNDVVTMTDHYAGEYEVVDPPLPVDPVAEAQASMEALALQRMRHQNETATMRQLRY
ncbi:hypothetical protein R1flu_004150 [Riccia fluitans]|uniref:PB1 domain-containing protein n=1 Tax=Riccia fluitans TaxID=41844 RepID=A0ABD1YPF9_9MARC